MTRLERFSLGLTSPLGTASGEISRREGYLVGVTEPSDEERESGERGLGEATPLPGWTESFDACSKALGDPPASWNDHPFQPERSETPAARHGYRLAVLDRAARAAGEPLSELLATEVGFPEPAESVPVNATVGDGGVEETVAAANEAVAAGFDCLKLKVGVRALEADVTRVRAVVDAVDATLRVDANGAWDWETAREAVESFGSLGVSYVEQPVPADALDQLAQLRGHGVDIAADESLTVCGVDALVDAGAADVMVLKPMALGGPDIAVAAARRLLDHGIDPVVTTTIDGAVARAAAVHVAAVVPEVRACGLATGSLLAEDFGPDPAPVVDGWVDVPEGPGNVGEAFDDRVLGNE